MSRLYVIHMKDEGNGSYYLTKELTLFQKAVEASIDDEGLMEFMNENEAEFNIVYSLDGINVIKSLQGYFY